jgi:hypothetical protein
VKGYRTLIYLSIVRMDNDVTDNANIIYAIVSDAKVLAQFAEPSSSFARTKVYKGSDIAPTPMSIDDWIRT